MGKYTIGIDYGTGSGRVVAVSLDNGEVVSSHTTVYSHGVMTDFLPGGNIALKRDSALQHPQDYLDVLEKSIPKCLQKANISAEDVIGIGIDFTACTMLPVDETMTPLSFSKKWKDHPHAWVKLWKHHGAQSQADRMNELAEKWEEPWLKRYGGVVSSEWLLPKVLETLEEDEEIYHQTHLFIEASDWITSLMTGEVRRNSCAAGYKGLWNKQDGFVNERFLKELNPLLENIYTNKLAGPVEVSGTKAGNLNAEMAKKIGLKEGTPVAMGIIDAHAAVPAVGATVPGTMVLVMGTSTCHMLLSEKEIMVDGISGVVEDGIIPGFYGYEAGQAAVGDIFDWFIKNCVPYYLKSTDSTNISTVHEKLENLASDVPPGSRGLICLDWHNGNRTPFVSSKLSGTLIGLTLETKPEEIYRALIEATAFGTKYIIEQFKEQDVEINQLVACGGLPQKNHLMMQIYADVIGLPINISSTIETPALGAAMFGSVAAGKNLGGFDSIGEAAQQLSAVENSTYTPNEMNVKRYENIYQYYKELMHIFGEEKRQIMSGLKSF